MHIAQATPTVFLQNPETLVHLYQIFQTLFVPSSHRLRRGLPGYLILFAPHAFEPQRQ